MATNQAKLPSYRILGSSGLRVFPLSLGAMGFGEQPQFAKQGVHTSFEEAEKILLKYISVGGNFIDTANYYQSGKILQNFIDDQKR
jgi:aryl-alcohol dehydrogenase-like predicted oxidoreductase